ncbi:MAG TPA: EamA family transporter [Gaiellaceae bacterium]|nr:EamA family transporter [Gaiellaceae bacterium]
MAALFALGGAAAWGVGDFFGGLASRRLHVLTVLLLSQLAGLTGVLVWALVSGDSFPDTGEAAAAAGGGAAGLVGLAALYRGFAVGSMGIVAPISAASPLVPLAVDLARGTVPSALQWVGIAVVLAGIAVVSREPGAVHGRRVAAGAGLAVVAALGFGLFVVGLDAAAASSVPWTIVLARATSVSLALLAALVVGAPLGSPARFLPLVLAIGVFDTGANVLVAQATTVGSAGIVAVLSALYPLVTIALARIVLGERLRGAQRAGGAAALAGAALVAAG